MIRDDGSSIVAFQEVWNKLDKKLHIKKSQYI